MGETSVDLLTGTVTRWMPAPRAPRSLSAEVLADAGPVSDVVRLLFRSVDTMSSMIGSPLRVDVVPDGTSRSLFALVQRSFRPSPEVLVAQRDNARQLADFDARLAASGPAPVAGTASAPAPVEFPSGSVEDLADGLSSGRYTIGERIPSSVEVNVNALDGPSEHLVVHTRKPLSADSLQQGIQVDIEGLDALRDAGLGSPNHRLVRWRDPGTGSEQLGIVMDRLHGTRFHVLVWFDDEPESAAEVEYSPAPGPDLINESTVERLRCARAIVVDCGLGFEFMQGVLTPSGIHFLEPGMVLNRLEVGDPEWQRELHQGTLAQLDRLIADVQRRGDRITDDVRRRTGAAVPEAVVTGVGSVVPLADPADAVTPPAPREAPDPGRGSAGSAPPPRPRSGSSGWCGVAPRADPPARPGAERRAVAAPGGADAGGGAGADAVRARSVGGHRSRVRSRPVLGHRWGA